MTFKKLILKIHLWLGLASGLIVVILGITGCLYVFEEELRPLVHDYYYVDQVKNKKLPLSQIIEIAKNANQNQHPKQSLSGCRIINEDDRTVIVWFYEELDKEAFWYWNKYQNTYLYVDPYTGKIKEYENYNSEFLFLYECCIKPYVSTAI